jgi:hypothetical protein
MTGRIHLSQPRQLASCEAALPEGWRLTAWFWDIESGRMALERRGRSNAHERIDVPLPRDGGLTDLLAEADHPSRRFDAVICESIDRLARRTYIGTRIEHELEQAGVRLYAADEPIDPRGATWAGRSSSSDSDSTVSRQADKGSRLRGSVGLSGVVPDGGGRCCSA